MPRLANKETGLSARARKLLARVRAGAFYMPYGPGTPKAMAELVAAGLVATTGRVTRIHLCFVPSSGYKPFKPESFLSRERKRRREAKLPRAIRIRRALDAAVGG